MKKTSTFFCLLIICIILSSCMSQGRKALILPSNIPESSVPVTLTQTTVRLTETLMPTETATVTPTPYPLKQVLLNYTAVGSHTPYEIYYADYGANGWSALVLYTDGQLIIPGH